jgi:hypothetical protein
MLIRVTEKHIERGRRHDICACPIALAIREQMPFATEVKVYATRVAIHKEEGLAFTRPLLPPDAIAFICAFDAKRSVQPFEFELPISQD